MILNKSEVSITQELISKGYKYIIQFEKEGKLFGNPIAFKTEIDVGPFMRDSPNLKTLWIRKIEEHLQILKHQ